MRGSGPHSASRSVWRGARPLAEPQAQRLLHQFHEFLVLREVHLGQLPDSRASRAGPRSRPFLHRRPGGAADGAALLGGRPPPGFLQLLNSRNSRTSSSSWAVRGAGGGAGVEGRAVVMARRASSRLKRRCSQSRTNAISSRVLRQVHLAYIRIQGL